MQKILAPLLLLLTSFHVYADRYIDNFDDGGGSGDTPASSLILMIGFLFTLTFVIYKYFKKTSPLASDEANFNFAWIIALVIFALVMAAFK